MGRTLQGRDEQELEPCRGTAGSPLGEGFHTELSKGEKKVWLLQSAQQPPAGSLPISREKTVQGSKAKSPPSPAEFYLLMFSTEKLPFHAGRGDL